MKRNWDTIREILIKLEECELHTDMLTPASFPPERATEISDHMELLIEARLVDGKVARTLDRGPYDFFANRLTWNGHEFLDAIRNDAIWQKTKKVFVLKGVSMTFELVKSVASDVAAGVLKSSMGGGT